MGDDKKDTGEMAIREEARDMTAKKAAKKPEAPAAAAVPPIPAAPAASAEPAKYRVLEGKMISWRGGLTHLRKDKILSEAHFGKDGIAHLMQQGVKLEPVK